MSLCLSQALAEGYWPHAFWNAALPAENQCSERIKGFTVEFFWICSIGGEAKSSRVTRMDEELPSSLASREMELQSNLAR